MLYSSSQLPAPGRLFLPGCAIAAGLLAVSSPLIAAPVSKARPKIATAIWERPQQLRVGQTAIQRLMRLTTVQVEEGRDNIVYNADKEFLSIKCLRTGSARLRLSTPGKAAQIIRLNLVAARVAKSPATEVTSAEISASVSSSATSVVQAQALVQAAIEPVTSASASQITAIAASDALAGENLVNAALPSEITLSEVSTAPVVKTQAQPSEAKADEDVSTSRASTSVTQNAPAPQFLAVANLQSSAAPAESVAPLNGGTITTSSPTSELAPSNNLSTVPTDQTLPGAPNTVPGAVLGMVPDLGTATGTTSSQPATGEQSPLSLEATGQGTVATPPAPPLPSLATPTVRNSFTPVPTVRSARPPRAVPAKPVPARANSTRANVPATRGPQISPILPAPARGARANVNYRTAAQLPRAVATSGARQGISVTQGLARLISFPTNILAVFFSDPTVMDARAINARTIAVTGVGPGASTLAVFTAQFPGDAVGRANIYRIQTTSRSGATILPERNPSVLADAITAALSDPRVRATVISKDNGSLFARLSGTVRNQIEVDAAKTTASFFVPVVVSSLYADANSATLEAVSNGTANLTPEGGLQENLRRVTGNSSIEIVPLPVGLAFKAEVGSVEEAESLLRILPTLNQQIVPFIVVRGQQSNEKYYNVTIPLLNGEDRQLTQKLQDVLGIRTVYAVRTSSNSLACYGNVRTRAEYDSVRRFMNIMAQTSVPAAVQGTSQGGSTLRPQGAEGPRLPNYDPTGGYGRNLGLQMFVNITDPGQSVIRKVTVETSIVEISRTALNQLGLEYGTVNLTGETVTGGATTLAANGLQQTSPVIINRTIDPTFNAGTALAGTGFVGGQSLGNINPFRVRLQALVSNGDARILSRPNVTSIEGAPAQITIGGERPVPKAVATQGAVGTQVEFRRYGVIISMRPTVTNNDTILLQIRADITQPDRTFEINLNGALIPGETVRSVDTTLNVRPGDTIVMGGLITNERRQQTSKVPILGDLPIIGSLFRSRRFENNETELAIFMTPQIEAMPADRESIEASKAVPSFPALPSRQESDSILFRDTTRTAG